MKKLDVLAAILLVVGGLNWGLVALAKFDLVAFVSGAGRFGSVNALGAIIYSLVGLAALYQIASWKAIQRRWAEVAVTAVLLAVSVGLAAPALAGGSCGTVQAQAASTVKSAQDIVGTAVAAGNFNTLVAAVKAAGLVETLQGKGPFTVFAPTDAAFAKLGTATVEALLKDKAQLAKILTYHVVPGRLLAADVLKAKSATTVQGQKVTFGVKDDYAQINGAKIVATDVLASNGVIHVIDTVILPK
jgi:uncharacterized surface protein with fasciclin (FAS1) repeats